MQFQHTPPEGHRVIDPEQQNPLRKRRWASGRACSADFKPSRPLRRSRGFGCKIPVWSCRISRQVRAQHRTGRRKAARRLAEPAGRRSGSDPAVRTGAAVMSDGPDLRRERDGSKCGQATRSTRETSRIRADRVARLGQSKKWHSRLTDMGIPRICVQEAVI